MEFSRKQFWTAKAFGLMGWLAFFVLFTFWYGSVNFKAGAKFMADTNKALQLQLDGIDYCEAKGVYYPIKHFNPRGLIFRVGKGLGDGKQEKNPQEVM